MKQHRIKKRVNFQRTKSNMPQIANGKGKKQYKKVRKRLLKQTDIAKKRRLPQKTANETTENKKTTGKISNGNGRNVPKAKERGKGQKTI